MLKFGQFTGSMPKLRLWIVRYAFALLCVTLATIARLQLNDILQDRLPFGTYFLAVIMAAWLGGTGPALLCLVTSVFAAAHFIVEPANSLLISDSAAQLSLLVYGLVGIVSITLFHGLERKSKLASERFERIQQLNLELTAADKAKDEFISVLAHELRNPLAPMQSAAELLQHPAVSPAQVVTTGQMYARHLSHMRRLVDDLFDVSRYLRGQLKLQFELIDLRQPVGAAIEFIDAPLSEKSQVLKVLMPREPLMVQVDPVRITQIVSNLLVNSVKFTPHGGCITLLVEQKQGQAQIVVSDSGIGIDPSMHTLIFEPFNQVVPGRARLNGGLGLGLSLVKKLIELHSGQVHVSSAGLGRGSSFILQLPLPLSAPERSPTLSGIDESMSPTAGAALATGASLRTGEPAGKSILIVDDNQDAANSLAMLLRLNGFTTEICYDGVSAIQLFEELRPAFVLLDIGLPNIDGYEVAQRMRQLDAWRASTIIAVTGWGGDEHQQLSRTAGIEHHLVKPVLLSQLLPLLKNAQASLVADSRQPS